MLLTGADQLSSDELPPKLAASDWNPAKNTRDRAYLMPVITPCRPRLCATHGVTRSTRRRGWKGPPALFDDSTPSASLDDLKAQGRSYASRSAT